MTIQKDKAISREKRETQRSLPCAFRGTSREHANADVNCDLKPVSLAAASCAEHEYRNHNANNLACFPL